MGHGIMGKEETIPWHNVQKRDHSMELWSRVAD
jgi:hypothetical protein